MFSDEEEEEEEEEEERLAWATVVVLVVVVVVVLVVVTTTGPTRGKGVGEEERRVRPNGRRVRRRAEEMEDEYEYEYVCDTRIIYRSMKTRYAPLTRTGRPKGREGGVVGGRWVVHERTTIRTRRPQSTEENPAIMSQSFIYTTCRHGM